MYKYLPIATTTMGPILSNSQSLYVEIEGFVSVIFEAGKLNVNGIICLVTKCFVSQFITTLSCYLLCCEVGKYSVILLWRSGVLAGFLIRLLPAVVWNTKNPSNMYAKSL